MEILIQDNVQNAFYHVFHVMMPAHVLHAKLIIIWIR